MFLVFVLIIVFLISERKVKKEIVVSGFTMGSIPYNLKYISDAKSIYKKEVDSILINFNNTFSTYISTSEISQINSSEGKIEISPDFYFLLKHSKDVFEITGGAFDPTIGPLVNAWGFGPDKKNQLPTSYQINKLKNFVGFDKLIFDEKYLYKKHKETYLDFSSIAKGYAVDIISDYLLLKGINNFFIEIGGEVRSKGKNLKDNYWRVGINRPSESENELIASVPLKDMSVATSGNYRNYYVSGDSIIFHTIDPNSGYPSYSNMISSSVFSSSCFLADAYSTAFMVLGYEKSKIILNSNDKIDGFLIYKDINGNIKTFTSDKINDEINIYEWCLY